MNFGRRARRARHHFGDNEFGLASEGVAGPLIGGGIAQAGTLATKLLFKGKPNVTKWASLIGTLLGAGVSGYIMTRPGKRSTGISGILTAALVGIPRQIEEMMPAGTFSDGYLGLITPERDSSGYAAEQMAGSDIQLLDSGLGVITQEQEMGETTMEEQTNGPVELLGGGGFGSNFLQ